MKAYPCLTPVSGCPVPLRVRLQAQHRDLYCGQLRDAAAADVRAHVLAATDKVEFRLRQSASGATAVRPFKAGGDRGL